MYIIQLSQSLGCRFSLVLVSEEGVRCFHVVPGPCRGTKGRSIGPQRDPQGNTVDVIRPPW